MPQMNDRVGAPGQLDIGLVITTPMKDPEWWKKCAIIGLLCLVPIAGALNLSGWMKAYAARRLKGGDDVDTLPDANLSYIGAGWGLFLAWLPMFGLMMAVMLAAGVVAGIGAAVGHGAEVVGLVVVALAYLFFLGLSIAMAIVGPAVVFLHVVDGEPWASTAFRQQWQTMRAGGVQYLLLFVAVLVSGMIAQLGVLACFLGLFVTVPWAQAMQAVAITEYARLVSTTKEPLPGGGNVGGTSGTPFGVPGG
jgi:hypothetical protein